MIKPTNIAVSLCFRDFDGDPDQITQAIGLSPTVAYIAGDKTPAGRTVSRAFWCLSLSSENSLDLNCVLEHSFKRIELLHGNILELTRKMKGEKYFGVGISVGETTPAIYLTGPMISRIAQLGLDFDIDLF